MSESLRVGFTAETTRALCAEAERRHLLPQVLVKAAINAILAGGLLDAVIDGDDARQLSGGHGRDLATGLTMLQSGLIYLIGTHAGRDGACRYSISGFQMLLDTGSWSGVRNGLSWLVMHGYIARVGTGSRLTVQAYRLTHRGGAVFAQLAGHGGDGGEG
ncbi:hypothetical protein [Nitratireductor pacificus]|uniref:Uncharacterized protein n=1 Tax=Nitratireductor pacificus pht-3B TaxID=391937 RepID=K2MIU3_9HYPH|nr:hypothetical protein [Nitratireductor pacificus]EKF17082.1 hypothetical protein NA2_19968 [Nitratireductor pacificus pht-3B]